MKNSKKMVVMFLTCASAPVMAQTSIQPAAGAVPSSAPQCAVTNFDEAKNAYTVKSQVAGAVNQQCFFTVMPKDPSAMGSVLPVLAEYPAPRLVEGQYIITLSGGGGGGGAGMTGGGGGGGAGALPAQHTRYLAPGIYRMTLGTGGEGGIACQTAANGGMGTEGNPTSLSEAYTGTIVAGYPRAEYWAGAPRLSPTMGARSGDGLPTTTADGQVVSDAQGGQGAPAVGGQSRGGAGGLVSSAGVAKGQDGGMLGEVAFPGTPGAGGNGFLPSGARAPLAGGGGGGAGYGHGGDGQSAVPGSRQAMAGELGAGGGGGAGGPNVCGAGGRGGDGFIAIRPA